MDPYLIMLHQLFLLTLLFLEVQGASVKVHYIRHGQSTWNTLTKGREAVTCSRAAGGKGCYDAKLTDKGWKDAIKNQAVFEGESADDYVFFSSPLRRAFATLVSATKKMNFPETKTKITIRPELRETGSMDTFSKVLQEPPIDYLIKLGDLYREDLDPGREKLKTLLETYPTADNLKDLTEQSDPYKWDVNGQPIQGDAGINVATRFDVIVSVENGFNGRWFRNTLAKTFPTGNTDEQVRTWAVHMTDAFKTMAAAALEGRTDNPRKILIGGHSQIVFALTRMTRLTEGHTQWPVELSTKALKIANGAILTFTIDSESGLITSAPTLNDVIVPNKPRPSQPVCFEHLKANCNKLENGSPISPPICIYEASNGPTDCAASSAKQSIETFVAESSNFHSSSPFLVLFVGITCFGFGFLMKQNFSKEDAYVPLLDDQSSNI